MPCVKAAEGGSGTEDREHMRRIARSPVPPRLAPHVRPMRPPSRHWQATEPLLIAAVTLLDLFEGFAGIDPGWLQRTLQLCSTVAMLAFFCRSFLTNEVRQTRSIPPARARRRLLFFALALPLVLLTYGLLTACALLHAPMWPSCQYQPLLVIVHPSVAPRNVSQRWRLRHGPRQLWPCPRGMLKPTAILALSRAMSTAVAYRGFLRDDCTTWQVCAGRAADWRPICDGLCPFAQAGRRRPAGVLAVTHYFHYRTDQPRAAKEERLNACVRFRVTIIVTIERESSPRPIRYSVLSELDRIQLYAYG